MYHLENVEKWYILKYLRSSDITTLIINVLKVESLNASALISRVKRASAELYQVRYGQRSEVGKRIIYKCLKKLMENDVVRCDRDGRSMIYRFKESMMFEVELRDIVQRLKTMVEDGSVKAYAMEEQKRFAAVGAKAREDRERFTSPIVIERQRFHDLAVKKYFRDIYDAAYGRNLIIELVELSNNLKNQFEFGFK